MEIMQIVGLGLAGTFLIAMLRQVKPEMTMFISLSVVVIVFGLMLGKIEAVFQVLKELATRANVNLVYMSTVLKIIGIAYIAEFGSQICRDAGEGAIAAKVEFAAKIFIIVLAIPIVLAIMDLVIKMVP